MALVAIFARSDHPQGWGFVSGLAHGYSLLAVDCADEKELKTLRDLLFFSPFYGTHQGSTWDPENKEPGGYSEQDLWPWFGGRFDHVITIKGQGVVDDHGQRFTSFGDNRAVTVYRAQEIIDSMLAGSTASN